MSLIIPSNKVIRGPIYSSGQVPTSYCARYVRLAAKDLFDLDYPRDNAWKIRSHEGIETIPISSSEELEEMAREGLALPGMLVGFNYAFTSPKNRDAALKEGVDYTHMGLLIDTQSPGGPFLADKFKSKTRPRIALGKMPGFFRSLKPRELVYLKDHFR